MWKNCDFGGLHGSGANRNYTSFIIGHADSNFAVIHFFWDRILGIYRRPDARRRSEFSDIGLDFIFWGRTRFGLHQKLS